jgi:hypothetical protein
VDPLTPLALLLLAGLGPDAAPLGSVAAAGLARLGAAEREIAARYEPVSRQVTNWRIETAQDLEPRPVAALAALIGADRPVVTRCVRLNNYWCIKRARWSGEVGADEEGHVGFASAEAGADAAATLLRRYYLEFDRRSAAAIVRRWAPAECGAAVAGGPSSRIGILAVRGIGGTIRARYLASRRRVRITAEAKPGAAPAARAAARVSAVIPRALPTVRVPDIAAGLGERSGTTLSATLPYRVARKPAPARAAGVAAAAGSVPDASRLRSASSRERPGPSQGSSRARPAPSQGPSRGRPEPPQTPSRPAAEAVSQTPSQPPSQLSCAPDEQRLRNYAGRIAGDVGLGPDDDLRLFEPDGTPMPNLAAVLLAMSSFELGALRAGDHLVAGAVERQAARARDRAEP